METYSRAFINFKKNNYAILLPIAKFVDDNVKNIRTGYTSFELNCGYDFCVFFKKNTIFYSWSKIAKKISSKLRKMITIYLKNLYHA